MLQAMSPAGPINVKVLDIKEDVVVLDANHPLAGQKLIFDLEVISIS
jgi:FKBP-type peptidyl-prolyl cis-trans isomerase 2